MYYMYCMLNFPSAVTIDVAWAFTMLASTLFNIISDEKFRTDRIFNMRKESLIPFLSIFFVNHLSDLSSIYVLVIDELWFFLLLLDIIILGIIHKGLVAHMHYVKHIHMTHDLYTS